MTDRNTHDQVEAVIAASHTALNQVCSVLSDRDVALRVMPAAMFLTFAAVSQYQKHSPHEQLRMVNAGLDLAGKVLGQRSSAAQYGRGRAAADVTLEMAQKALELAKKDVDETNLVVDRKGARDKLLYKSLIEFCVVAKILEPLHLGNMMSNANELVAQVLQSGWLDRNVIKLS